MKLFIPGRLCLAGEHSDWAAAQTAHGCALVVALKLGLHAQVYRNDLLSLNSQLGGSIDIPVSRLLDHAKSSSPWCYVAAVAHLIHTRFTITGSVSISITNATLPAAKGFSSSAALCVLVARAYNRLYSLQLSTAGEMFLAYQGERLTGSSCGQMDQVVAIGPGRVARMVFHSDGSVSHSLVPCSVSHQHPIHIIVVDLMSTKDTSLILSSLQKAIRMDNQRGTDLADALGTTNLKNINAMERALKSGDAKQLGLEMSRAQELFDRAAMPCCPEELTSPVLHSLLSDETVKGLTWGGKGVGSQGDGAAQFVARGKAERDMLIKYIRGKGMQVFPLTIGSDEGHEREGEVEEKVLRPVEPKMQGNGISSDDTAVRTAVIPVAGLGTRLFPASQFITPKAMFPIVDTDGIAKPVLIHLIEQCVAVGIDRVVVVVSPGKQEGVIREMISPPPKQLANALKPHQKAYVQKLQNICDVVEIAVQDKPDGLGDAVVCANVSDDAFLLLLGDVVFKSRCERSCIGQLLDAHANNRNASCIGVKEVPTRKAGAYGVVRTCRKFGEDSSVESIEKMVEKPGNDEAGQLSRDGVCNIVLGPYVLSSKVMRELRANVEANKRSRGEIQLTDALISTLNNEEMCAVLLNGDALDTGNPVEYVRTMTELAG